MNKKLKQALSVFTICGMLAGLVAGCGGGGSSSKDIKIGVVYELTGNTASFGTAAANGAKLAFKEINAKGGVLGKQIQIVTADNKGEPAESAIKSLPLRALLPAPMV
jgi:branched-chain amino acid transport system substrate-binding protein